jgi:hypothetical protein
LRRKIDDQVGLVKNVACASVLSLDPPVRLEQAEQARNVAEGRNVGHARRQPLLDRRPLCPLCSRLSKVVSHELRSTRPLREGTLREHSCGHARPLAVSRRRSFSGVCGWFVSVDSLACPRFPPLCSMVRRGSPVRVRKRASGKCLQMAPYSCPPCKRLSRAGTRGHYLMFPRWAHRHAEFSLFTRIRTSLTPSMPRNIMRGTRSGRDRRGACESAGYGVLDEPPAHA